MKRRFCWLGVVGCMAGCVGEAPPLPEPLGQEGGDSLGPGSSGLPGSSSGLDSGTADSTGPTSECGNGGIDEGEECDGANWQGATCESLGFVGGALACSEECRFDTSGCSNCGNGEVNLGEECDGSDLNAETCAGLGYSGSGLSCTGCQLDASECEPMTGMVDVPGGVFTMGSTMGQSDEEPVRLVQVDRFWMDETEVTVAAYEDCVDAGVCGEPGSGGSCNWMVAGRGNHPINCVDWSEATQYCGWVGGGTKRLPTEAEWEKAARGTDAREYPWGDAPAPSCLHVVMNDGGSGCGTGSTMEVGSKPAGNSPYGAQDMSGNVWEWVSDWYGGSYEAGDTANPTGPASGSSRVLRGGSWSSSFSDSFRAAYRNDGGPSSAGGNVYVGFRCARIPPAAP